MVPITLSLKYVRLLHACIHHDENWPGQSSGSHTRSPPHFQDVLEDVASGLVYLHKRAPPVMHRDLTAKNVLLTSYIGVLLLDHLVHASTDGAHTFLEAQR